MSYQFIATQHQDGIATITIQRPKQLNALNQLTIEELNDAILKADQDPEVRCLLLTGSGDKAFVAGADIKEFADFTAEEGQHLSTDGQYLLFDLLDGLSTPSIAAVNGFARIIKAMETFSANLFDNCNSSLLKTLLRGSSAAKASSLGASAGTAGASVPDFSSLLETLRDIKARQNSSASSSDDPELAQVSSQKETTQLLQLPDVKKYAHQASQYVLGKTPKAKYKLDQMQRRTSSRTQEMSSQSV
mgnify:CR=1 FL=1